mmetsp:Transcript_26042/g.49186  ORF Transcript_26042/g.49186 Transcript_26042/m.49186 type:complete len:264 (+) Transcript_26042:269-1060(+)
MQSSLTTRCPPTLQASTLGPPCHETPSPGNLSNPHNNHRLERTIPPRSAHPRALRRSRARRLLALCPPAAVSTPDVRSGDRHPQLTSTWTRRWSLGWTREEGRSSKTCRARRNVAAAASQPAGTGTDRQRRIVTRQPRSDIDGRGRPIEEEPARLDGDRQGPNRRASPAGLVPQLVSVCEGARRRGIIWTESRTSRPQRRAWSNVGMPAWRCLGGAPLGQAPPDQPCARRKRSPCRGTVDAPLQPDARHLCTPLLFSGPRRAT